MPKPPKSSAPKIDLYQTITDKIVASLEAGVQPWHKPWRVPGASGDVIFPRRVTGQRYSGINVVLLWWASLEKGFQNPTWMTFKQAKDLGGNVRKGEKGELVIYANRFLKEIEDTKTGEKKKVPIPFLKSYVVFNCEQIDGLPERFYLKPAEPVAAEVTEKAKLERIAAADTFFEKVGADVRHKGAQAFFSPSGDFIQMPEFDTFDDAESYYATLGHEHIHWTGHESRIARKFDRFGSEAYAAEELVAELGSAFLCAILGITPEIREDHASYIQGWLKVLKGDKRFIFTAASQAQKAVDLLQGGGEAAGADDTDEAAADAVAEEVEPVQQFAVAA